MRIHRFENAYGINSLDLSFYNNKLENIVIYASNGVFKTSFAKTMDKLRQGEATSVKDRLTDCKFSCDIDHEDKQYSEKDEFSNVIVYSPELYENKSLIDGNYINNLVVSEKQKEELFQINKNVNVVEFQVLDFFRNDLKLKDINEVRDIKYLLGTSCDNKLDCLIALYEYLIEYEKDLRYDLSFINRANFSQVSYEKAIDDEFLELAKDYSSLVNQKFEELFDQNFNITNVDDFLKILKDTKFLSDHRKIKVGREKEFKDYLEFEQYVERVKKEVYQDDEVIESYQKLEKKLNQTKASKDIRSIVKKGKEREIEILSLGRNHLALIMYGDSIGFEKINKSLADLKVIKNQANDILNNAKEEKTHFEHALAIYEERFEPPFKIEIDNNIGSFLGIETPEFVFKYKYPENKELPKHSEKEIRSMLSSGERTALDILRFIVEYESKKENNPVIIIDDIVETFDYANRSGMLAYLDEIKNYGSNLIILTHNFDFFRLISSRLDNMKKAIATKNDKNVVKIKEFVGPLTMRDFRKKQVSIYDIIALIPIARTALELRSDEEEKNKQDFFNDLLHIRQQKEIIKIDKVIKCLSETLNIKYGRLKNIFIKNGIRLDTSYYEFMLIERFTERPVDDLLSYKMFLAIQSRLLLENLLIKGDYEILEDIFSNQTINLIEKRKAQNVLSETALSLSSKVRLYSPEFIHFNVFMYEPLIDVCPRQLEKLVKELFEIESEKFYIQVSS